MLFFGQSHPPIDLNVDNSAGKDGKVIFVNRFCWPDSSATSQMLTDVAEHVAATGRSVLVIASQLFYNEKSGMPSRRDRHKGVEIRRVRTSSFNRHSIFGQLINFVTFYPAATLALLRHTRPHDIIIVKTDPPMFLLVAWLVARVRKAKVINWCQDLFPEIAIGCGIGWASGPLGGTLRAMRNFILTRSDRNVVVSPDMQTALKMQGLSTKQLRVIRNWSDRDIHPVSASENSLRRDWGIQDCFVLGYSGNLGRAHLADKILLLVRRLADVPNLKILFIGAGYGMEHLQSVCREEGYSHVLFRPYQLRTNLSLSLSAADLHLVSLNSSCQGFMSPSKYYGVLAAGRPVVMLGAGHSALANEIENNDLGFVLNVREPATWRPLIESVQNDHERLVALGASARRFYERRLAPEYSLASWVDTIAAYETSEVTQRAASSAPPRVERA